MRSNTFKLQSSEGHHIAVREWLPDSDSVRAVIVVAHGAAEHGGRYARFAEALTSQGYAVVAPDHRGHGETAGSLARAGNAGPDGFNGMIRDLKRMIDHMRERYPTTAIYLLGHSMGAALAQRFIQLHGASLQGVILSGSPGLRPNLEQAAAVTAANAQGEQAEQVSTLFQQAFASYNQGFEPIKSGFEWLSRDAAEVQKYVDDPWCGFPFTNALVAQMSQCALEAARRENIEKIPQSLPVYFFSGTHDRVGGNGDFVEKLAALYRECGIRDVQLKLYAEGRHEMLNETNREEVQRNVIDWLRRH